MPNSSMSSLTFLAPFMRDSMTAKRVESDKTFNLAAQEGETGLSVTSGKSKTGKKYYINE